MATGGRTGGPEPTGLHRARLAAVARRLVESGASTVLDLGCGPGFLIRRLLDEPQFTRVVGVDVSLEALSEAALRIAPLPDVDRARVQLRHGSFMGADEGLTGFDAAALVETIEHVPPGHLSKLELAVFGRMRPRFVIVTTPNREHNARIGLARGELRHDDHRFEWDRARFERWTRGVAARRGYEVDFDAIGPKDPLVGAPTQMAILRSTTRGR